jgi:hypothetical protein
MAAPYDIDLDRVSELRSHGLLAREIGEVLGFPSLPILRRMQALGLPTRLTADERFWKSVNKTASCWLWTGHIASNDYGIISIRGTRFYAHRWSYEYHVGPIPEGMHVDHLCMVKACVNPAHLEAVTPAENTRRASKVLGPWATGLCQRGHDITNPSNVYRRPDGGGSNCAACSRLRGHRRTEGKQVRRAVKPTVRIRLCAICGDPVTDQMSPRSQTCSLRCRHLLRSQKATAREERRRIDAAQDDALWEGHDDWAADDAAEREMGWRE